MCLFSEKSDVPQKSNILSYISVFKIAHLVITYQQWQDSFNLLMINLANIL